MPQASYLRVKRFGVFSVARTAAIFGLALGIIFLVAFACVAALGGAIGFAAGIGVGVAFLIALVAGGFVWGAVGSFLYNVIVRVAGCLRIVLRKGVVERVDPLSYAKISFVFSLIVYGLLAIFVSSILLAAVGIGSGSVHLPLSLLAVVFVFALVVYGFILPYIWALVYNWLAGKIGGVGVLLKKGRLERIDVWSYVKIVLVLSVIIFIVERVIGGVVGLLVKMPQPSPVLSVVLGFVAVVVLSLVVNALVAWFYNLVAKKFGGVEVDVGR